MSDTRIKYFLLATVIFAGSALAAQEASVPVSEQSLVVDVVEVQGEEVQVDEVQPEMSLAGQSDTDIELMALSPFTEVAQGTCSVVSGMLAEFCKTNPGDISCGFQ